MEKTYIRFSITLPTELAKQFKKFVRANGINVSSRIAVLIEEDLKNKKLKIREE